MDFNDNSPEEVGNIFSSEPEHQHGDIFIEKEVNESSATEVEEEEIESWGVYMQGKEKTLLGLFWDLELARLFADSVQHSQMIEKVKEIV